MTEHPDPIVRQMTLGIVDITIDYIRRTLELRRNHIYTLQEPLEHTAIRLEEIERLWQMFELDHPNTHQNERKPQ